MQLDNYFQLTVSLLLQYKLGVLFTLFFKVLIL